MDSRYKPVVDEDSIHSPTEQPGSVTDAIPLRCMKAGDYRDKYRLSDEPPLGLVDTVKRTIRNACSCDVRSQKKYWSNKLPVWRIMKRYKWRQDLPSDIVAGLTVGIMQLPQGMAYALLAELPPVVGLYMAFFPVLIYFLMGTSRHISMGTVALCSLLTGSVVSRFYDPELAGPLLGRNLTSTLVNEEEELPTHKASDPIEIELPDEAKLVIASSVCLLVGLIQLGMGFFHMGFITTYMSDPMIGGFTTGAAVHVGTSQVKYIFGLHIPRSDGVFQIIKTYVLIFQHIAQTNVPTIVMSAVCMVILYTIKVQINQRFKDKLKFPIPCELIVVVGGTLLSHFLNFSERYHMKIIGKIPAGLPKPAVPSMPSVGVYTADAFIIAIVAFSQCVGLAALMAKKHGYSFDASQELIAYGAGNIFGSFFSCYPYAASVSRSSVQESAGGKTQLASVVSAILVLIVIVSIGPLFESLPNCVLASIIVVALKSLFMQFLDLPKIYKVSVYDFWIWIVTFLAVVVLHVDYGILLGMLFSFFTVVVRSQRSKIEPLQKIEEVGLYENTALYRKTEHVPGVRVIGYNSPIYYANGAIFVKQVYAISGVTPEKKRKDIKRWQKKFSVVSAGGSWTNLVRETKRRESLILMPQKSFAQATQTSHLKLEPHIMGSVQNLNTIEGDGIAETSIQVEPMKKTRFLLSNDDDLFTVHTIILDLSGVNFIDSVGAKVLKQLTDDYKSVDMKLLMCNVNDDVWRVLDVDDFLKYYEDNVFVTVEDAINYVKKESDFDDLDSLTASPNGSPTVSPTGLKYAQNVMFRSNSTDDADENVALTTERESVM